MHHFLNVYFSFFFLLISPSLCQFLYALHSKFHSFFYYHFRFLHTQKLEILLKIHNKVNNHNIYFLSPWPLILLIHSLVQMVYDQGKQLKHYQLRIMVYPLLSKMRELCHFLAREAFFERQLVCTFQEEIHEKLHKKFLKEAYKTFQSLDRLGFIFNYNLIIIIYMTALNLSI